MSLVLLLVTAFGLWNLLQELHIAYQERRIHAALSESIAAVPEASPASAVPPENAVVSEPERPEEAAPEILPQFWELYAENDELFGWIKIEGTALDYPVMHSLDDAEKYLHHSFNGAYSYAGEIFVDHRCHPDSDNLILYGHKMQNSTMFADISKYAKKSYWQEHLVIRFDTLYEQQEFAILAAFYDKVYLTTDTCFKYYNFIDAGDAAAISYYRGRALYDTGVTAAYGDPLIILSTCSYHVENGRFVVVAKKITIAYPM